VGYDSVVAAATAAAVLFCCWRFCRANLELKLAAPVSASLLLKHPVSVGFPWILK
jgi:hypothetical protein